MAGQLAAPLPAITQLCQVLGAALSQLQATRAEDIHGKLSTSPLYVNGRAAAATCASPAAPALSSPQLFSKYGVTRPLQSFWAVGSSPPVINVAHTAATGAPAAAAAAALPSCQQLRSVRVVHFNGMHQYHTTTGSRSKRRSWAEAPRLKEQPKAPTRQAQPAPRLQPPNPLQVSAMLADAASAASAVTADAAGSNGSSSSSSSSSFERANSTKLLGVRVNTDILTRVMKTYAVGILLLVVPLGLYILFINFITSGLQLLNMPQGQALGAARIRQVLLNGWCVRHALDCGVAGALVDQLGPHTTSDVQVEVIKTLEPLLDVQEGRDALIEAGLVAQLRLGLKQGWLPSGVVPWAALTVEYLEAEAATSWRPPGAGEVERAPQQQQQQQQQDEQEGQQQGSSRWWHWRPRMAKHTSAPGPGVASV